MTLLEHIKHENEKINLWVAEDPKHRCAGTFTENMDHWKEYGVTTPEEFDRYILIETIWDAYKEAHGVRPRWIDFKSMSTKELEEFLKNIN